MDASLLERSGLPKDWVLRPAIDLELKQYVLLAYLQRVRGRFKEHKLYPHLDELRFHWEELVRLRKAKDEFDQDHPGGLVGFDPRTFAAIHTKPTDDELLDIIDLVIDFALPGLEQVIAEGSELRNELAESIRFTPLGVQPLLPREGWLLLRNGRETRVYAYSVPLFREVDERYQYRSVVTRYLTCYTMGLSCTYEHIKADLMERHRDRPVPATYVFEAEADIPHIETFMPLAKQLVYERVIKNGH